MSSLGHCAISNSQSFFRLAARLSAKVATAFGISTNGIRVAPCACSQMPGVKQPNAAASYRCNPCQWASGSQIHFRYREIRSLLVKTYKDRIFQPSPVPGIVVSKPRFVLLPTRYCNHEMEFAAPHDFATRAAPGL